jgi:hypothetical protein
VSKALWNYNFEIDCEYERWVSVSPSIALVALTTGAQTLISGTRELVSILRIRILAVHAQKHANKACA